MVDPAPRDPALATLADLELGRVLGRGVSGRVLRVRDRRTAATYALKTIEKSHIKGEAQLTNLYREKELLGALRHPAIVRFHVTLKDEARLYFLLEQLEGGELPGTCAAHLTAGCRRRRRGAASAHCCCRCGTCRHVHGTRYPVRLQPPSRVAAASITYGCRISAYSTAT